MNEVSQPESTHNEGDGGAVGELGADHTTSQLGELLESGIPGVHFCSLNCTQAVSRVLEDVVIAPRISPWRESFPHGAPYGAMVVSAMPSMKLAMQEWSLSPLPSFISAPNIC